MTKKEAINIINILKNTYPEAKCSLDFTTPFEMLIAVILSAQCTDERVNKTTPNIFSKYSTPKDFANIDINNYINDLITDLKGEIENNKEKKRTSIIRNLEIGKKQYKVQVEFAKTKKSERKKVAEYMIILYFMDETEKYELQGRTQVRWKWHGEGLT